MNSNPLEIDPRSVKQKLEDGERFVLLDCRERDEYAIVRIAGAELWPMSEISDQLPRLAKHRDQEIVVYCHHSLRSLQVAVWLRQQGYLQVSSLAGGIDRWAVEIDPGLPRY